MYGPDAHLLIVRGWANAGRQGQADRARTAEMVEFQGSTEKAGPVIPGNLCQVVTCTAAHGVLTGDCVSYSHSLHHVLPILNRTLMSVILR